MIRPRPQRIAPSAPIGSLLKREITVLRPKYPESDRDPEYLALVRACPCIRCGQDPAGVAAHLRLNSGAHCKHEGMGRKPSDRWTTPLCSGCHTNDPDAQHRIGEVEFWGRLGLNPFLICQQLYAQRGDIGAMRAVIFNAIANREKL